MDEDWKKDGLCAGSDRWFTSNQYERAEVVRLCRNECPVYRACLDYALSGVPVYGIVAGLNMTERDVRPTRSAVTTVKAPSHCLVCGSRNASWTGGRPRKYCSSECSVEANRYRNRKHRQRERISA